IAWARRRISAEATLRPANVVRIEAPEDGTVVAVFAKEGDSVASDATLFRLSNPSVQSDAAHFAAEEARLARLANVAREAAAASDGYPNQRRHDAATAALANEEARRDRLEVKTPIRGTMLTARIQDLQGRFVPSGTVLAEVGDCGRLIADLPVSERLLSDLQVGAPVRALVAERSLRPLHGE